jgi:hypothetical protein
MLNWGSGGIHGPLLQAFVLSLFQRIVTPPYKRTSDGGLKWQLIQGLLRGA